LLGSLASSSAKGAAPAPQPIEKYKTNERTAQGRVTIPTIIVGSAFAFAFAFRFFNIIANVGSSARAH
jgi:hypothetical protein